MAMMASRSPLKRARSRCGGKPAAIRNAAAVGEAFTAQFGNDHLAGTQRIVHADGPLQLQLAVAEQPVGRAAGQQLVEQHAEGIDVGGRGDRAAEYLFGRGVFGSEYPFLKPRHRQGVRQALRSQQLRNAEIQQLGRALVVDEDVGRLDVPVHHQVAVRVLHRRAHLNEQLQPLPNEQGAAVAVGVDGFTVHEFHHQVRRSVFQFPLSIKRAMDG